MNHYDTQLETLRASLEQIERGEHNALEKSRQAIRMAREALVLLRKTVMQYDFDSLADEVHFFKEVKPAMYAELFFYTVLFDYELKKQGRSSRAATKLTVRILKNITGFLESHHSFHHYYQLKQTHFDDKYFRRLSDEMLMTDVDCWCFQEDNYATTHDILAARILASQKLSTYLKGLLDPVGAKPAEVLLPSCHWTSQKTDLIELVYALQAAGCVDHGKLEHKCLMDVFAMVFDVDLQGYRRTYLDIKARKNPVQFLDYLKACLLQKIEREYH